MPKRYSKATLLKAELVAAWKEIEASERARANLQADLNAARVEVLALDGEIERAKRIAGANHAMFSPMEREFNFDERSFLQVAAPFGRSAQSWMESVGPAPLIRDIKLDVLLTRMRDKGLLNDGAVHFRAKFRDGVVGYALSEKAIEAIPADILAERMSSEMAAVIVKSLKG